MTILCGLLAILVGLAIWLPSLLLFTGSPFGAGMAAWEALSYFAPIIFITIPAVLRALDRSQPCMALWFVSLAPLLGLAGLVLSLIVDSQLSPAAIRSSAWSALVVVAVCAAIAFAFSRVAGKGTRSDA